MSDVAVIMAAHNEQRYVERAIRSCLTQSHPATVVVVNDGSTDSTGEIARKFPAAQVTLLTHHRQQGLPAAINTGIRHCSARYVVRVDADDYVHPDFILALRLHLELNEDVQAAACDYLTVDDRERHLERRSSEAAPIGCGIMFRKQSLIDIGLYDESFPMAEDLNLRLRFTARWPILRVPLPLYRYRLHGENMTVVRAAEYAQHLERAAA